MAYNPEKRFNSKKCIGCGICSSVCPSCAVITTQGGLVTGFTSSCIGCGHCGCYCPENCFGLPELQQKETPSPAILQSLYETRRSTRIFSDDLIDEDVLQSLLAPVGFSPTGRNTQNITVEVITGRETIRRLVVNPIEKLVRLLDFFKLMTFVRGSEAKTIEKIRNAEDVVTWNAPCLLLFRAPLRNVTGKTDAVIAATMVSIKAEAMGLGSLWNGVVQIASPFLPIKKCHAALCVGYPRFKKHQFVPERKWNRHDVTLN